jgi:hypothetical protein
LALLTFVILLVDGLLSADSPAVRVIDYLEWVPFAVDYATRIHLAEHRWAFVQSHPLGLAAAALPAAAGALAVGQHRPGQRVARPPGAGHCDHNVGRVILMSAASAYSAPSPPRWRVA